MHRFFFWEKTFQDGKTGTACETLEECIVFAYGIGGKVEIFVVF